ncbi:MAG: Ig-like domain-containing protein [candidate division KSB1 bacterium]|nr:Ig-like domain-containing protein [candidate division KSB1 bacterium]MDZ7304713.1 Ig-like domain-containing protein [candidate division KSB1 bacterium]MDZ7312769.1 Ig-like domain-containing protein [candidate division KSB1 bacterium]
MKSGNIFLILAMLCAFIVGCTKEIERIIYADPQSAGGSANGNGNSNTGSIVGVVMPKTSAAKVLVRQATPIDSTIIDPSNGVFRLNNLGVGNYDVIISATNYGTRTLRNVSVSAGGVTYVGEIRLSTMPDLIEAHFPEDNGEVVFNRRFDRLAISIAFTKPMDRASLEAAFSTDPPSEGVFYWGQYVYRMPSNYYFDPTREAAFADYYDKNVGATITSYRKIGAFTYLMAKKDSYTDTTYTVTLSTAAHDTGGTHLKFPLRFRFSTVQSAVTQNAILTDPQHGDTDVDLIRYSGIRITFPRRMDPLSTEAAFSMTPKTDHILIWPEGNQLLIYTGGPLFADTQYMIRIDASARDLDGVPLGEKFEFSFQTRPVEVTGTSPGNGELFVQLNPNISLAFDTYMVKSTVQAAFSITPAVAGQFVYGYPNGSGEPRNMISFIPSSSLRPNTKYTINISTVAQDLYGAPLKTPYSFAFVTRPE